MNPLEQAVQTVTGTVTGISNVVLDKVRDAINAPQWFIEQIMHPQGVPIPNVLTRTDVFVIHGHDEAALTEVADAIRAWGLRPIILKDQPGALSTIKEKFEKHAYDPKVGFAVALLTPDDEYVCKDSQNTVKRPRQNVVFELGFFMSAFRGKRASVLVKGEIEMPSDIAGVVYIRMDGTGAWKKSLAQELREADMTVASPVATS